MAVVQRVAVTGGIAEGKSTVLGYLRDMGLAVDSSDAIARMVFETPQVQEAIAEALSIQPPVDPALLRNRLVDPAIRRSVNAITHPEIVRLLRTSTAQFVEVPLLIEACLQGEFDRVWVVTCGVETQLERLAARIGSEVEARALIGTQLPTRAKIAFADRVIRTNQSEANVMRCVSMAAQRDSE